MTGLFRGRSGAVLLCSSLIGGVFVLLVPGRAHATPGQARRLAGVEAQGPASRSVTGLHHNPATLAKMPGFQFTSTVGAGIDHLAVRRFDVETDGTPTTSMGSTAHLANPSGGYFFGASFFLDPIAIGAGLYDLSSQVRPVGSETTRYHLAADPNYGCAWDPDRTCPDRRAGGTNEIRTEFTLAIAYDFLDRVQLGLSLHFPRLNAHFSHDNDTSLTQGGETVGCSDDEDARVEDPRCAERLSFSGRTRLRWFGLNPNPSTRFDFAATLGIAFDLGDSVTLGGRFRTLPVLNRGQVVLNGEAVVCSPEEAAGSGFSELPACTDVGPVEASVTTELGREAAVGGSFVMGRARQWQLDTNLYWLDLCPRGVKPGECDGRDAYQLSLVGLDRDAHVLPESLVYRGRQDVYGAELWARYQPWRVRGFGKIREGPTLVEGTDDRLGTRVDLLLGAGFASPGVRPNALTASASDGWTISASVGTSFEILRKTGSLFFVPGYGLDFLVPTRVGPGGHEPAFDPTAGPAFEASGGDINDPHANTVLEGRARPSNAALYTGAVHTFIFGFRWAERGTTRP